MSLPHVICDAVKRWKSTSIDLGMIFRFQVIKDSMDYVHNQVATAGILA